jgi:hypothetical protein
MQSSAAGAAYAGAAALAAVAPGAAGAAALAPAPQALFAMGAQPPPAPPLAVSPPAYADVSNGAGGAEAPLVQVRCPACAMTTMATPGQPSVCFSCGQPLPAEITKGGGGVAAPGFPLTGAVNAQPLVPPPNPYAGAASAAVLRGSAGQYTVRSGSEMRVGRDPAQCPVVLNEPRISGWHATLRVESGQLLVRDETSNNGTWVGGSRIAPGVWTPVPAGTPLRFGPVEFSVQLEG